MVEFKNKQIHLSVGTAVVIMIFISGLIYSSSVRLNTIENSVISSKEDIIKNAVDIATNKENQVKINVANAEIKTKLASIEATLIEIKQAIAKQNLTK